MRTLSIAQAATCLNARQIVALPTDTIYGMSALVTQPMFKRLCELKQRPLSHSFVLLVDDIARMRRLVDSLNMRDARLLTQTKRTSWLLPAHSAPLWLSRNSKIALRVCPHPVIQALCKKLDAPLFSTSFNRHQELACVSFTQVTAHPLACMVAGIVLDEQPQHKHNASTICDMQTKNIVRG